MLNEDLKNKIYFVIPAWNEEKAIGQVLKTLKKEGFTKIIVIDDGSKDKTFKIAKSENVIALRHVLNRGQGASLKTGIDYALTFKDCKYIVTFDSDGQHRISDLEKFIKVLEKKESDIVLGSRFLKKESKELVPIKKRILLKGSLFVTLFLSRLWLSDSHNGYRVMNRKAARTIDIKMDEFEHASEILDEISRKKVKYSEVPVFIDYTQYSKSKGQKITNSIKILFKMIFKN